MRINKKRLNKIWKRHTQTSTTGVSIIQRLDLVLDLCGEEKPRVYIDRVELVASLLHRFRTNGDLKAKFK